MFCKWDSYMMHFDCAGWCESVHISRGNSITIQPSHAIQKRSLQNGSQGRKACGTYFNLRRSKGHALVLVVSIEAISQCMQSCRARTDRIGGKDGAGACWCSARCDYFGTSGGATSTPYYSIIHFAENVGCNLDRRDARDIEGAILIETIFLFMG